MKRVQRGKAVVTGASLGIGEAVAKQLAANGAQVLLVARNAAELGRVAAEIAAAGGSAFCYPVDIAASHAAGAVVSEAIRQMGGLDILINCASLTRNIEFFELTDEQWRAAFEVKVLAAIALCKAAWPALATGRGSIVNICGIGARTPSRHAAITAATSSALLAITKVLAEIGVADGVQVNAINPGLVNTPRIRETMAHGSTEEPEISMALTEVSRRLGAVRTGCPEDVASLVAYILSPAGEMLQGALIDLDGGATKGM